MESGGININLLVEQLRQGSEVAFTFLYDKYSKQLHGNICRLVKDEEIAQELLQDLFMTIWKDREKLNPEKSFKSYLYKVAENLVYAYFRQIAKNKRLIDKLILSAVEFDSNAEDIMIVKENHDLLKKAIENLSPQRKQIYTLCKLEGKSYEEVSKELSISTSTIRDHIVKANKTVKQYFYSNQNLALMIITAHFLSHLK
ncbi:MAG: sigma-70 family RNA polymerase sigma factor [Mucilaginibacter sp.]|uniref:RNA polymerase sigma factor n=1 Tax=Mucilaginibacter sp. TaxID=1882438 RepID=UPI00326382BA